MSSPSQRRGICGHLMAGFDPHKVCARCRDKKKGQDPCVEHPNKDCLLCNTLTPAQKEQLSTPSYKLKKERKDSKVSATPTKDSADTTLVDPDLVTVVGVVDDQTSAQTSEPVERKKKSETKKSAPKPAKMDKSAKASSSKVPTTSTSQSSSADDRITDLDRQWSDRFNRLEALLLARTLEKPQEPVFETVKVTPAHTPAATAIREEPFLKPASHSQITANIPTADLPQQEKSLGKASSSASAPAQTVVTDPFNPKKDTESSSDSDSDSLSSDQPMIELLPEEGELSDDIERNSEHDQSLSEEQSYRETMRGIRSYMNWTHIPDVDSGTSTSEDNPFAGPKVQPSGKVSVQLPTDEWLCRKMARLNITLAQGYPTRSAESGGLLRDQFVKPPKSQQKWYGAHSQRKDADMKDSDSSVTSWHTGSSKLNSTYLRIARRASIATSPPMSRAVTQENLRKWEKSARESTLICNHAAGFNRCLVKIQDNMSSQLKAIKTESKGKSGQKTSAAVDELQFLLDFNAGVCQAMAKAVEHLTEFVFVSVANTTLLRRDSYLEYLKAGVKADTLNALRSAPLHLETLFPDSVVKRAGEDIADSEKGRSGSSYKGRRFHPYERQETKPQGQSAQPQELPAWKSLSRSQRRRLKGQKQQYSSHHAKGQQQRK